MSQMKLRSQTKRKFRVTTTDSKHNLPVAENILNRNFAASAPNVVWLADITYIQTDQGTLYLNAIMDLYSRKIVGWSFSDSMRADIAVNALTMAVLRQKPDSKFLLHSDRGSQYASKYFSSMVKRLNGTQSMSRKGNCWDNAPMESFFHSLKTEYIHHQKFSSMDEAIKGCFEWIEVFYNRQRIHSSIGYKTPVEKEESYVIDVSVA
jgi:transposase InsO family protein